MLPIELQTPPPRDLRSAGALFERNRSLIRSLLAGGVVLPPAVLAIMWLKFGAIDGLSVGLAAGVGALVELFAVALIVQ